MTSLLVCTCLLKDSSIVLAHTGHLLSIAAKVYHAISRVLRYSAFLLFYLSSQLNVLHVHSICRSCYYRYDFSYAIIHRLSCYSYCPIYMGQKFQHSVRLHTQLLCLKYIYNIFLFSIRKLHIVIGHTI